MPLLSRCRGACVSGSGSGHIGLSLLVLGLLLRRRNNGIRAGLTALPLRIVFENSTFKKFIF
jgi:MYXO-CTERM domain-containing protein